MSQHLYANDFVSELDIFSCYIKPNGLIRWSLLKRLNIRTLPLGEDALKKILMGSPSLESLEFSTCVWLSQLDIVSKSMRKLVINKGISRGALKPSREMVHDRPNNCNRLDDPSWMKKGCHKEAIQYPNGYISTRRPLEPPLRLH